MITMTPLAYMNDDIHISKFITSHKYHTEVNAIRGLHSGKWYREAGPLRHGWRGGALMEEFTACLRQYHLSATAEP